MKNGTASFRQKVLLNFGLFFLFLIFYLGAAAVQTPALKSIAIIEVAGVPLGLLLSLAIFPISWIIIAIWFRKAK
jgi:uncharacterized membrane protein (DUF485 family)